VPRNPGLEDTTPFGLKNRIANGHENDNGRMYAAAMGCHCALKITRRAGPITKYESRSSLIFTSTRAFPVSDSMSWWIAYGANCLIDKEIHASNALLE
jgi:hypothetical protein